MRFTSHTLILRSAVFAAGAMLANTAGAQAAYPFSTTDTSTRLSPVGPAPLGAYPRVAGVAPVDDGWVTDVGGLAQIEIEFDRPTQLSSSGVRIYETPGGEITSFDVLASPGNTLHTIRFTTGPATATRLRVVLNPALVVSAGMPLDGEITNPQSPSFPSGDGRPGGECVLLFNILAGDANRDGVVDSSDAEAIVNAIGAVEGDAAYNPNADFNRDGFINVLDVAAWTIGNGSALSERDGVPPTLEFVDPAPGSPLSPMTSTLAIEFSEPISPSGVTPASLTLIDELGTVNEATDARIISPTRVEYDLSAPLVPDVAYSATISNAIADLSGELLQLQTTPLSFTDPNSTSIFPPRSFPVGFGPRYAASGDVNNDGEVDFVVSNSIDGTLSVLLGNGDGTFMPQILSPAGATPRGLTLADFDMDGALDAAVALEGEGAVAVLYGDNSGSLGVGLNNSRFAVTGASPISVASGQINADGFPDIAVVNSGAQTVSILLPQGDRTIGIAPDISVTGAPSAVAVGQLVGDSAADLAVTDEANDTVTVFTGLGDGQFLPPARGGGVFPTGAGPVFVGIGDLDNDKDLDLVTANKGGDSTTILTNLGAARGAGFVSQTVGVGDGSVFVGIGDLDNDKDLDLASADSQGDTITPVKQGPAGQYASEPALDSGDMPVYVAIVDVNNDGETDVISVVSRDAIDRAGSLVIRLGEPGGGVETQNQIPVPSNPVAVAFANIAGSVAPDLVVASEGDGSSEIAILTGDGAGGFSSFDTIIAPEGIGDVIVADVIGGSTPEIIVAISSKISENIIYEDNGEGFSQVATLSSALRADAGDALPEIAGNEIAAVTFFPEQSIGIYNLMNQRGSASPAVSIDLDGGFALDLVLADFNGDDLLDVAAVGVGGIFSEVTPARGGFSTGLVVYLAESEKGLTFFNFAARVVLSDDLTFQRLETADVNGDMSPDLLIAANEFVTFRGSPISVGTVTVLEYNGDADLFDDAQEIFIGEIVGGVVGGDFNNDGLDDFVASSVLDDEIVVFQSASGGGFFPPQRYETHIGPVGLAAADVNDDGAMDVAVANAGSDDVSILLGQSLPAADSPSEPAQTPETTSREVSVR